MRELKDVKGIEFIYIYPRYTSVHWFTTIFVDDAESLKEKEVLQVCKAIKECFSFE